ncbi:MAG: hypothetical protein JNK82_18290, partial [Myxococcaceae bacterium]|nr:hypothetical protein [Myxococcaceae bacterium]
MGAEALEVRATDEDAAAKAARAAEAMREELGPVGRALARHYFEPVRFPQSAAETLQRLSEQGFVVHVMRT